MWRKSAIGISKAFGFFSISIIWCLSTSVSFTGLIALYTNTVLRMYYIHNDRIGHFNIITIMEPSVFVFLFLHSSIRCVCLFLHFTIVRFFMVNFIGMMLLLHSLIHIVVFLFFMVKCSHDECEHKISGMHEKSEKENRQHKWNADCPKMTIMIFLWHFVAMVAIFHAFVRFDYSECWL